MRLVNRMMAFSLAAVAFLPAFAAELDVGDGTNDNTYSDKTAYEGATKIIKTGTGKTTLGFSSNPTFTGEIEVREGTLAVASSLLKLGTPSKITVLAGAMLDMSEAAGTATAMSSTEFVIAGTGVGDAGALCRTSGKAQNAFFRILTLSADATIKFTEQLGFDNKKSPVINLNGHTLSVAADVPSGYSFYLPSVQIKDNGAATPGGITMLSGTIFPRNSTFSTGTADNVLTLKNGTTLRFRDMQVKPKWKVVTEGNVKFNSDSASTSSSILNTWVGPVVAGGEISVGGVDRVNIEGGITNCSTLKKVGAGYSSISGTNYLGGIKLDNSSTFVFKDSLTTVTGKLTILYGTLLASNSVMRLDADSLTDMGIGDTVSRPCLSIRNGSTVVGNDLGEIGASARFLVGMSATKYGLFEMEAGTVVSNAAMVLGDAGSGAFYQKGGSFYWPVRALSYGNAYADSPFPARRAGSYAYYGIGGDFTIKPYYRDDNMYGLDFGRQGTAVFAIRNAGRFSFVKKGHMPMFATGDGGHSEFYVGSGGKCLVDGYLDFCDTEHKDYRGSMVITVEGEGSELSAVNSATNAAGGIRLLWMKEGASGVVNVNHGGMLSATYLYSYGSPTTWYLNMNGGVIRPYSISDSGEFTYRDYAERMPAAATVYEDGVTIDTSHAFDEGGNKKRVIWNITLSAPGAGKRIAAISLPTDAGFAAEVAAGSLIGSPVVTISGAGTGASAFALYDDANHAVTNIIVTSPGWGYADDGSTVATLSLGGLTNSYACAVTLEDQPATGWKGLRKCGAQPLIFRGTNELVTAHTFKGDVTVEEGAVYYNIPGAAQGGMPVGAGITLWEDGSIVFPAINTQVDVPFLAGCGTVSNGYVTVTNRIECTADDIFAGKHLRLCRNLTLADGVMVVVTDPENLVQYRHGPAATVVEAGTYYGTLVCDGAVNFSFGAPCATTDASRWSLRKKGNSILLGAVKGTALIMR